MFSGRDSERAESRPPSEPLTGQEEDFGKPGAGTHPSEDIRARGVSLLFLYREVLKKNLDDSINAARAKKPTRLPTVMTREETMRVIAAVSHDYQLLVKLIYGSGLRLMECGKDDPSKLFLNGRIQPQWLVPNPEDEGKD